MICQDWRDVSAGVIEPLYEAERARWAAALGWNIRPTLAIVEAARACGKLPGLLARDRSGAIGGWAFYVPYERTLQIGGLVAQKASNVRLLLDAILDSPDAAAATAVTCFVYPPSPAFASALVRLRFQVRRHLYLERDLTETDIAMGQATPARAPDGVRWRSWKDTDLAETVRLLARGYAGSGEGRCFAPSDRFDQWAHYLRQLVCTPVCGVLLPAASLIVETCETAKPLGIVMTTSIGPMTAHVAQIAVDPTTRRSGLGESLMHGAFVAAASAGCRRVTLIVGEENEPARALYRRLGFRVVSEFVFASRTRPVRRVCQPRLSTSAAFESGGAITLR